MEMKFESGMSKLYELRAEFKRSLENIKKLKKQYGVLIKIVEESYRKKDIPDNFVKEINEYKKDLDRQLTTITTRKSYLDTIIGWYEKQDDFANKVDQIVTLTLEALGIRGEDPKEVELEEELKKEEGAE